MTFSIPDDILREAGLSERELLVEVACRLFDAGKLSKESACRLCGLERVELESQLHARGLAVYRTTLEDYEQDREALRRHRRRKAG